MGELVALNSRLLWCAAQPAGYICVRGQQCLATSILTAETFIRQSDCELECAPSTACSTIISNQFCFPNGQCHKDTEVDVAGKCECKCDCSEGFQGTQCKGWPLWKVSITVVGGVGGVLSLLFTIRSWRKAQKQEAAEEKETWKTNPQAGSAEVEMTVNPAAAGGGLSGQKL